MKPLLERQEIWALLADMSPLRETDKAVYFAQVKAQADEIFSWVPKSHIHSVCEIREGVIGPLLITQWIAAKKPFAIIGTVNGKDITQSRLLSWGFGRRDFLDYPQQEALERSAKESNYREDATAQELLKPDQSFPPMGAKEFLAWEKTVESPQTATQAALEQSRVRKEQIKFDSERFVEARATLEKFLELGQALLPYLTAAQRETLREQEEILERQEWNIANIVYPAPALFQGYLKAGQMYKALVIQSREIAGKRGFVGIPGQDLVPPQAPPRELPPASSRHQGAAPIRIIKLDDDE